MPALRAYFGVLPPVVPLPLGDVVVPVPLLVAGFGAVLLVPVLPLVPLVLGLVAVDPDFTCESVLMPVPALGAEP